jgi:carbamoylphosphate synthase small subunit
MLGLFEQSLKAWTRLGMRDVSVNRINLNDQTVEGMQHKRKPIFRVQYHPEAGF